MTIGRLLVLLDPVPTPASRTAFAELYQHLMENPLPTFAVGLAKDVTLSLTAPYDDVIYNALEFIDVYDAEAWNFLHYTETFTVLNGVVYAGQVGVGCVPWAVEAAPCACA